MVDARDQSAPSRREVRKNIERRYRHHPSVMPLVEDHHRGLALALRCRKQALGQMRPVGVHGLRERADELTDFISKTLERHFRAEEEVLFPLIGSRVPESRLLIAELQEGHGQIRKSSVLLKKDTSLSKSLFDLGDLLERHIRSEERELFPLFKRHVTEAEAGAVKKEIKRILEEP
ncbi:MAG: hemerythrin domain-containing protein [Candidatus Binatia bacterium]